MSKKFLLASTAISAMIYVSGAGLAQAACVNTAPNVWVCDDVGTTTGSQIVGASATPNASITVEANSIVDTSAGAINVTAGATPGAVTITNSGTILPGVGGTVNVTPTANDIGGDSLNVTGGANAADNNVTISNSGTLEGSVRTSSIGGTSTLSNSGTLKADNAGTTGAVNLSGAAGTTIINSGTLTTDSISLNARHNTNTPAVAPATVSTNANDGGAATIANTGTLTTTGSISMLGDSGASVTNGSDMTVGGSLNLDTRSTNTTADTDPAAPSTGSTNAGGAVSIMNDATGNLTVTGSTSLQGEAGATVENMGDFSTLNVSLNSNGFTRTLNNNPTAPVVDKVTTVATSSSTVNKGGIALVTNEGTINSRSVSVNGTAGATVTNMGTITGHTDTSTPPVFTGGQLRLTSSATDSTNADTSVSTYDDLAKTILVEQTVDHSDTQVSSGGTATLTNESTGVIDAQNGVSLFGDAGATVVNDGAISGHVDGIGNLNGGHIDIRSMGRNDSDTSRSVSMFDATTGMLTGSTSTRTTVRSDTGGEASLTNNGSTSSSRFSGLVIFGEAGAMVSNPGSISAGNVSISSSGNTDTTVTTNSDDRTNNQRTTVSNTERTLVNTGGTSSLINAGTLLSTSINLSSNGNSSVDNAGTISGFVNADGSKQRVSLNINSFSTDFTSSNTLTDNFDADGNLIQRINVPSFANFTQSRTGGTASLTNAGTIEAENGVFLRGDAGASLVNTGTIGGFADANGFHNGGSLNITSDGRLTTSQTRTDISDWTMTEDVPPVRVLTRTRNSASTISEAFGGTATLVNDGTIQTNGSVVVTGLTGASVVNNGTIAGSGNGNGGNIFVTSNNFNNGFTFSIETNWNLAGTMTGNSFSNTNYTTRVGGQASVTNTSSLTIEGDVTINGLAGATLDNTGRIIGSVTLRSEGTDSASSSDSTFALTTVTPEATVKGVTTTVNTNISSSSNTSVGGASNTTIAAGASVGPQNFANGNFNAIDSRGFAGSTVTVDGEVNGGIRSASSGQSSTSSSTSTTTRVTTRDIDDTFNESIVDTNVGSSSSSTTQTGGASTVTINGGVDTRTTNQSASIDSRGFAGSTVTIAPTSMGVRGSIFSQSRGTDSTFSSSFNNSTVGTTSGGLTTTVVNNTNTSQSNSTALGGASTVSVGSTVDGSVNSDSFGDSTVLVDANVGSSVTVSSGGRDSTNENNNSFTSNNDGLGNINSFTSRQTFVSNNNLTVSANGGDSLVVLSSDGGTVQSSVNASSQGGDSTVMVGTVPVGTQPKSIFDPNPFVPTVGGSVTVNANASSSTFERMQVSINGGFFRTTNQNGSTTWGGGKARAEVYGNVNSSVFADGFESADVTIWGTGTVGGSVRVDSLYSNSTFSNNWLEGTGTFSGSTNTITNAGGAATATIAERATVGGSLTVEGFTSASAVNSGSIGSSVFVRSLFEDSVAERVVTNPDDAIRKVDTTTTTTTLVGGPASFTNDGFVAGSVSVQGLSSQVDNNNQINGNVTLGNISLGSWTDVDIFTVTSSSSTRTFPVDPPTTTGLLNNNGLIGGGISVYGPGSTNVVNLNDGSFTFGFVGAQMKVNEEGRFVDDTMSTLNLNGSGFLGGTSNALFDPIDPPFPGFFSGAGNVFSFEAINKTGSGTFRITADFLDANTTTIDDGRLEIASWSSFPFSDRFGSFTGTVIDGDLVNNAELVAGVAVPRGPNSLLDNLTRQSNVRIDGNDLWVEGNFTQSSSGTTFFGFNPSLARDDDFVTGTTVNEPLGTPVFLLDRSPFGFGSPASSAVIGVEGDTTLDGSIHVYTPEGVYLGGDQKLIFSTTGTVTNNASLSMSRDSLFVSLGFSEVAENGKNNTYITVNRSSYGAVSGANGNQVAFGAALDGALVDAAGRVQTDLAGGAGFGSVEAFNQAQDILNFTTALDFDLTESGQVLQVLGELDGQFQSTISALNLNKGFMSAMNTHIRSGEGSMGVWASVNANLDSIDGDNNGIDGVDANSTGYAAGFSGKINGNITVGFGLGKTSTNIDAKTRPEQADIGMTQVGLYTNWALNAANSDVKFSIDLLGAYSWGNVMTERALPTFGRMAYADYDASELRGNLQFNAELELGNNGDFTVEPYVGVDVRQMKRDAFTEQHSSTNLAGSRTVAGLSLSFDEYSETSIDPYIGARVNWNALQLSESSVMKPYFGLRYTHVSADALTTARLAGGGNSFAIQGADVNGYVTVSLGSLFVFSERFGAYLGYNGSFGGGLSGHNMTGGFRVNF